MGLLVLLLAGCEAPGTSVRPVRIGLLVDFGSTGGPPSLNAAKLFVRQVNERGGLVIDDQPRPLELVIEDTHLDPSMTMAATRRLVYQERVDAIVGPNYSSNVIAAAPVVEAAEIVLISPGATLPEASRDKRFVFRVAYDDPQQGRILAEFATNALGLEQIAVLYDVSNPSSRSVAEAMGGALEGVSDVAFTRVAYVADEREFAPLLDELLSADPQAVALPNPTGESLVQARLLADRGFTGVILGSDNWGPDAVASEPALQGAYYTQHWNVDLARSSLAEIAFIEDYRVAFKSLPTPMAALTYDAMNLLTRGIENAGLTGPQLAASLRTLAPAEYLTGRIDLRTGAGRDKRPILLKIVDGAAVRQSL